MVLTPFSRPQAISRSPPKDLAAWERTSWGSPGTQVPGQPMRSNSNDKWRSCFFFLRFRALLEAPIDLCPFDSRLLFQHGWLAIYSHYVHLCCGCTLVVGWRQHPCGHRTVALCSLGMFFYIYKGRQSAVTRLRWHSKICELVRRC